MAPGLSNGRRGRDAAAQVSSTEIEHLFREAQAWSRQHARDHAQHSLSQAYQESQVAALQDKWQAAKARNVERERFKILERVLLSKRFEYARRLRPSFCTGSRPLAEESVPPEAPIPEPRELPELDSWRAYESRVPPSRKQPVRSKLCQALRAAGIEGNVEGLFEAAALLEPPALLDCMEVLSHQYAGLGAEAGNAPLQEGRFAGHSSEGSTSPDHEMQLRESGARGDGDAVIGGYWRWRMSLRSHMDGVRDVVSHGDVLLSCGEDTTIKAWDLQFLRDRHGTPRQVEDLEPYATYRGHASAVLSLACGAEDTIFYSGGLDANICVWQLLSITEYDPYEASPPGRRPIATLGRLAGHTDAVWELGLHPGGGILASLAADDTIRLWRAPSPDSTDLLHWDPQETSYEGSAFALRVIQTQAVTEFGADKATGLAWVPQQASHLLAGFASSKCAVLDVERGSALHSVDATDDAGAVTSLAAYAGADLAMAGHANGCAQVFSPSSGQVLQTLAGHGDAVTCVAIDPQTGYEVVTGCHDGRLRFFDLRTGLCVQQLPLHQQKFDEALHCVCHAGDRVFTGGADANISVLSLAR